ncbi:MAG TPA: hypothetical protein VE133_06160 [Candidatus Sulfotelmatobacter sp.]|nr:hypothetical protein [Candidatus Sulfotelmatobacter sp.]
MFSEILDAFMRNPEMVDNLEGIARWRIMNARIQSDVEETKEVLDALVSEGYLLAIETADGPLFQANREKLAAAKRLMQDLSGSRTERTPGNLSQETNAMPVTYTNTGKQLTIMPMPDGTNLYLAPGETSAPFGDSVIHPNSKIEKLVKLGHIRINRASSKIAEKPAK